MEKILTVSIAAYHVEEYLEECLDSFLISEFGEKLEVLIINDGSGEGIDIIAQKYVQQFPNIFRLIDKENGGHGSTVNRGIDEASGKYFKTVDGDDKVRKEGLTELMRYLAQTEVDMVVTDYQCFDNSSKKIIDEKQCKFPGEQYGHAYIWEEVCDKIYVNMHAVTFCTDLLRAMGRKLDEHCFYVDAEYVLYPIPYVKTIAFLCTTVYLYRLGMTTQSMDIKNMQKNCGNHELVLSHILDFYSECNEDISSAKRRYIAKGAARILTSQFKIYMSYPTDKKYKKKIQELDRKIKNEYPEVYHSVTNLAVKMLRYSRYHLYKIASVACRRKYKV